METRSSRTNPQRPTTPARLLAAALATDPARPFLTFYDDATGERVELSLTTLDNWVAKTANFCQDGLGTEPGERVALLLPTHWQGAVWMLAAWSAGLVVDLASTAGVSGPGATEPASVAETAYAPTIASAAEIVVTSPEWLAAAVAAGGRDTVALALRPLGGPFTDPLPAGVWDYGAEVASYADEFHPYVPVDPDAPSTIVGDPGTPVSGAALVAAAQARADHLGLQPGSRLLTDTNPADPGGYLDALLAPLARKASVVLVRNLDRNLLDRRTHDEKVTHTHLVA
ncbi:TIGR03089 family protein [Actinopolymorpha sp. B17G11]|uniref:TIGR03089 family protein n=1 Tax=Actinopolymorpha sp. B17G11 TaxID=3160861 RepID=UPI0032E4C4C1